MTVFHCPLCGHETFHISLCVKIFSQKYQFIFKIKDIIKAIFACLGGDLPVLCRRGISTELCDHEREDRYGFGGDDRQRNDRDRNGLIEAVGANMTPPADAQVFDATGLTVYPGFIHSLTNLGLPAAPARPQGQGGGGGGGAAAAAAAAAAQPASNSNYPAGLRPEEMAFDDIRGGESQFEAVRNAGITTVLTIGRTGIFNRTVGGDLTLPVNRFRLWSLSRSLPSISRL